MTPMSMPIHLPTDPARRAGIALILGGVALLFALLAAQAADPPIHLGGLADANPSSGLLFVLAGAMLVRPNLDRARRRLAILFTGLGFIALAVPLVLRPFLAGA
jgi:peptidoglycan/LPS O-acetylase OafA/YrhL